MTGALAQLVVWLNAAANAVGRLALSPIGILPGWLSATLVSAVTGVLLLVAFKYTSNQRAIKRVRDDVNAHLLALKLFKDSAAVAFRAQGRILWGSLRLMALSVVPLLIMALPVTLVLAQLSLWYQSRPLRVGEDTVVTVKLNGDPGARWPEVSLRPTAAIETTVGPVRVLSRREVCWNVKAREPGYHRLLFQVDGEPVEKELAVGDGFMRVSTQRPGWSWSDALECPAERPFGPDSAVQSISIDYPRRPSWPGWIDSILSYLPAPLRDVPSWAIYWFVVSFVAALCFRRFLNVNL